MRASYRQPKAFGQQLIELHDRHLTMSVQLFGRTSEQSIWLRNLRPKARYAERRYLSLAVFPATVAVLCAWGVKWIYSSDSMPLELAALLAAFGAVFLWYVTDGLKPVRTFQFVDRNQQIALTIYGMKGQWHASKDFAEAIEKAIEANLKTAEPGATDNPDDAQRLREDT